MDNPMFKHSFLQDTLQGTTLGQRELVLENGVRLNLVRNGVLQVTPARVTPTTLKMVLSSGVHGNETAPIEIIDDLTEQILTQKIEPECELLLIIAHPEAMLQQTRFIETNLNRLFGEAVYPPTQERDIAQKLLADVRAFWKNSPIHLRWHLDLHCSIRASQHYTFAVSPQSAYPTRQKELIDFMRSARIEAVLLSEEPSSTFSWFSAAQMGAQAATLELGQVAPFGNNDRSKLEAFYQALKSKITRTETKPDFETIAYVVDHSIYRQHPDFEFSFADDLPNFSTFDRHAVLGRDGDKALLMTVEQGGIVFPNPKVELNQRAALIVRPCDYDFSDNQLVITGPN